MATEQKYKPKPGEQFNILEDLDLYEVSFVPKGANKKVFFLTKEHDDMNEELFKALQEIDLDKEGELDELIKDAKLSEKILRQLQEIIEAYGQKEGFDLILEKTQSAVLHRASKLDITAQIILLYNESKQSP